MKKMYRELCLERILQGLMKPVRTLVSTVTLILSLRFAIPAATAGGRLSPVNKLAVLAPYLALGGTAAAILIIFALRRRRKS